jgi:hypothetical protein
MTANQNIEVVPVGNGWIVRPTMNLARGEASTWHEVLVFNNFADMVEWMQKHFGVTR